MSEDLRNENGFNQESFIEKRRKIIALCKNYFDDFEDYPECVNALFEIQKCAFTSQRFISKEEFRQENLMIWLPTTIQFIMNLGRELENVSLEDLE